MSFLGGMFKKKPKQRTVRMRFEPGLPPELAGEYSLARDTEGQFHRSGRVRDLGNAIKAWEAFMSRPNFARADRGFRLIVINDTGGLFMQRYFMKKKRLDLDRALQLWEQAVAETPMGSEFLPSRLSNLGVALSTRAEITGSRSDLERAIDALQQAVDLLPEGSSDLPTALNNLGNGLFTRFERDGERSDLGAAVKAYDKAVELTPANSPDLIRNVTNFCRCLYACFEHADDYEALKRANQLRRQYRINV